GNSAVGLEEYKIDANGDAGVFKSYGYLVPEAGAPENAEKEYTGCIYIHAEGNDRQVYGSLNLQNPDTESIFRRDFANTVRQVEEQQLRDARKAAAEADKHLTPQQKRCNRMARDIDEMGADGTITEMESKRILQITIGMRNAGCSM